MYAILGDIQFDLIYFDGFDSKFAANYAEHAMIAGKPRLQFTGLALDEIAITLAFHHLFCDPEVEFAKLKEALANHQAMALVLGNGDYKGWFVLADVNSTAQQTDATGTITALEASISLREYVGDTANPLPPPAVQPENPPVQAVAEPAPMPPVTQAQSTLQGAPSFLDNIGSAVSLAVQARSALSLASDMLNTVQRLASNPLAALDRVPGLLGSLNDALGSLENLPASLSRIRDQLPMAADVLRAGNTALFDVQGAVGMLSNASASNVAGKISVASGLLGSAGDAMTTVSSGVGKAAAKLVTRSA
ncbi:MAG: phage tail protein [Proteobacteria bacterium]|nr:phage tail protein [Pseudomonadota bacterium]